MSNNFGCKLALKADEHDKCTYPFVVPNVFLEEYADPMLYDGGTKSLVLIEGDKMATYTRGSYIEIHKRDTAGNTMWVKSMDLDDFDDDHWDDEYEEDFREVKVHTITEHNFRTLEKKTYKLVLDETTKMESDDIQKAAYYLGGEIVDNCFVVDNGVLTHWLRPDFSLDIPDSVVEVGGDMFSGYWEFRSLSIPASLTNIPEQFFEHCSPQQITVAEGNPRYYTQNGCLIDRYTSTLVRAYDGTSIPDDGSVKRICANAFNNRYINRIIVIPDSVTEIESGAFRDSYWLDEVIMPDIFADSAKDIFGRAVVKEEGKWKFASRNFSGFCF